MAYYEGFEAVEEMQAASEAAGWNCEYRQMEAGQFKAHTVFQPLGKSSLIFETANRSLDISAKTPEGAVTVLVPLRNTRVLINGRRLTDDRLMFLAPDIDFQASSNGGAEVWSIHLDVTRLDESIDLDQLGNQKDSNRDHLLTFSADRLAAVRWRQFRVYMIDQGLLGNTEEFQYGLGGSYGELDYPQIFNIELDPREEHNVSSSHGWVMSHALRHILEYKSSLEEHPNPPAPNLSRH